MVAMEQQSKPPSKPGTKISKTLILGVLVLVFGILSVFGNYVQWANSERTRAKIMTSQEQWVRRGSNYLKLQVSYDAGGKSMQGEVYAIPAGLDPTASDAGIDVIYKKDRPSDVIAAATLESKRKSIPWIIGAGLVLCVVGVFFQFSRKIVPRPIGASAGL